MKPQKAKQFSNKSRVYKKNDDMQIHSRHVSKKEWDTLKSIHGKRIPSVSRKVLDQFFNPEMEKLYDEMLSDLENNQTQASNRLSFSTANSKSALFLFFLILFSSIGRAATTERPQIESDNSCGRNPDDYFSTKLANANKISIEPKTILGKYQIDKLWSYTQNYKGPHAERAEELAKILRDSNRSPDCEREHFKSMVKQFSSTIHPVLLQSESVALAFLEIDSNNWDELLNDKLKSDPTFAIKAMENIGISKIFPLLDDSVQHSNKVLSWCNTNPDRTHEWTQTILKMIKQNPDSNLLNENKFTEQFVTSASTDDLLTILKTMPFTSSLDKTSLIVIKYAFKAAKRDHFQVKKFSSELKKEGLVPAIDYHIMYHLVLWNPESASMINGKTGLNNKEISNLIIREPKIVKFLDSDFLNNIELLEYVIKYVKKIVLDRRPDSTLPSGIKLSLRISFLAMELNQHVSLPQNKLIPFKFSLINGLNLPFDAITNDILLSPLFFNELIKNNQTFMLHDYLEVLSKKKLLTLVDKEILIITKELTLNDIINRLKKGRISILLFNKAINHKYFNEKHEVHTLYNALTESDRETVAHSLNEKQVSSILEKDSSPETLFNLKTSPYVNNDPSRMLRLVKSFPDFNFSQYYSENLSKNPTFNLESIKFDKRKYDETSLALKKSSQFISDVLQLNGFSCKDNFDLQNMDSHLMLACLKKYPNKKFSPFYSMTLRNNPDFNYKAIELDYRKYDETSRKLKASTEFMLKLIKLDYSKYCTLFSATDNRDVLKTCEYEELRFYIKHACIGLGMLLLFLFNFDRIRLFLDPNPIDPRNNQNPRPNRNHFFQALTVPLIEREILRKTDNVEDFKEQFEAAYPNDNQWGHLYCPLSLSIMWDPVILGDGFSYDRPGIEESLRTRPGLNPLTNAHINNTRLITNRAVRDELVNLIQRFQYEARIEPGGPA